MPALLGCWAGRHRDPIRSEHVEPVAACVIDTLIIFDILASQSLYWKIRKADSPSELPKGKLFGDSTSSTSSTSSWPLQDFPLNTRWNPRSKEASNMDSWFMTQQLPKKIERQNPILK